MYKYNNDTDSATTTVSTVYNGPGLSDSMFIPTSYTTMYTTASANKPVKYLTILIGKKH